MNRCNYTAAFLVAAMVGTAWANGLAYVVHTPEEAADFPQATVACKVMVGALEESEFGSPNGSVCYASCTVIAPLKGKVAKVIDVTFRRNGNGIRIPGLEQVKSDGVYILMLKWQKAPYQAFAAMPAVADFVPPTFGTRPGDRLMAELDAMCKSGDREMRQAAVQQIGIIRDVRGATAVAAAAKDRDAETARLGLIAQYRMKIAPDAKRVMEVFNEELMNVWYQESGAPLKDADGKRQYRVEGQHRFLERGLPDFDYAMYVREGIKHDFTRKDDYTLYLFFGVPWKVQRKACVPELVKLLEHANRRVRWHAMTALEHTVEDEHDHPKWPEFQRDEKEIINKWRSWWKDEGPAYMAAPTTREKPTN